MSKNVLVVEGMYDKDFIQHICDKTLGNSKVKVLLQTPKDLGGVKDGWRGVVDNLHILLQGVDGDSIERFGIIIDADFTDHDHGGVQKRYDVVVDKLQQLIKESFPSISGYNFPKNPTLGNGDLFEHNNGYSSIGLWIMPSHRSDGMIEHFIDGLITTNNSDQEKLKQHSQSIVSKLPVCLFNKQTRIKKAELNSWLSWQEEPGKLFNLLDKNILDLNQAADFTNWLKKVFN